MNRFSLLHATAALVSAAMLLCPVRQLRGEPTKPSDLAATIFHLLGIGPDAEFRDTQLRPYRFTTGKPVTPLVG